VLIIKTTTCRNKFPTKLQKFAMFLDTRNEEVVDDNKYKYIILYGCVVHVVCIIPLGVNNII